MSQFGSKDRSMQWKAQPPGAATATLAPPVAMPSPLPATAPARPNTVEAEAKIRGACGAGLAIGIVTSVFTVLALAGFNPVGLDAWSFVDVGLILGLTYGLHRKSRACAVVLLVYFVASKILMTVQTGKPTGIVMGAIVGYYLFRGVQGTFDYRRQVAGAATRA